ncbi:hypothetical protein J4423_00555 [Candidatus Pacearchaeota archaeon]|nr:hypothetical protein [Candidatus Pacearchaeota archaeon]
MDHLKLHVLPRVEMTREEFLVNTLRNSIALDGVVKGGPFFDPVTKHMNIDHHDGVVREATMSTCKQVFYAIKAGLFESFRDERGRPFANAYLNDPDQDTSLSFFELQNYKMLEGTNGSPALNRLIELTDRLDVTAGAFPMSLSDQLLRQYAWIFQNYSDLRKSGKLAVANAGEIRACLEATSSRIMDYLLGRGSELELDTRYEILHEDPRFKVINEIGGNDARYFLFSKGLNAFISLVATRPDGNRVYSVGRRSMLIPFPVKELYDVFNAAEGLTKDGWGSSDIVGGSSRLHGSKLTPSELFRLTKDYLDKSK